MHEGMFFMSMSDCNRKLFHIMIVLDDLCHSQSFRRVYNANSVKQWNIHQGK